MAIVCVDHSHVIVSETHGQKSIRVHPDYDAVISVLFSLFAFVVFFIAFLMDVQALSDFLLMISAGAIFSASWNTALRKFRKLQSVRVKIVQDDVLVSSGVVFSLRKTAFKRLQISNFWVAVQGKDVLKDGLSSNNWIYVQYQSRERVFCRSLGRIETRAVMDFLTDYVGLTQRNVAT